MTFKHVMRNLLDTINRIILFAILTSIITMFVYGSRDVYLVSLEDEKFVSIISNDIDKLVYEYYQQEIPEDVFDLFWYHTREFPELRSDILAIMKWESGNFRRSGYGPVNKNGSYDFGYMQINSFNLKSPSFVKKFGPGDDRSYIKSYHHETIIMGINYYKYLHDLYGDNAFACYNGGPRMNKLIDTGVDNNLTRIVKRYVENVNNICSIINSSISTITAIYLSDMNNYYPEKKHLLVKL